ncbi:MAG: nidogen-like domain-containing protein [Myxococcota bacterium]
MKLVSRGLVLAAVLVCSFASAQVPLIDGLGGTAGFGADCLGRNDDGSSREISLTSVFPTGIQFFDEVHTSMFVNTNGNITFSDDLASFTPEAFPVADRPMIAPFWADVDIRGTACAEPDGGTGFAGDCHNPTSNGVWWHLDTEEQRVIVTWDRVGYYNCNEDRDMSFQLVLTPAETSACGTGGDFDVEFRFNTCEWNTGDASGGMNGLAGEREACFIGICPINPLFPCMGGTCGGIAAQSGFDAGNERDFVEIMGSRTNEIHTILCTMSNVGEPGIWRFQIRSGVVVCPDAGEACDTGMMGVCGAGRTQCVGGGTECRPEVESSDERCDALDNDCDGMVDEGSLCAADEICDRGVCIGNCFEGGCPAGEVCSEATGRCVDEGCDGVECPEGERCRAGECVGACDGVTCPAGLSCRGGRCVDLCAGEACDDCTACVEGACVPRCDFEPCEAGQACADDGRCVDAGCESMTCPAGQACVGGACTDACAGAVCPMGEICQVGECVPAPMPDAGVPDSGPGPMMDAGGGTDAALPDAGVPDTGVDASRAVPRPDQGCGCRVPGAPSSAPSPLWLSALGVLLWRRRRR